jgi:hypothetical protein
MLYGTDTKYFTLREEPGLRVGGFRSSGYGEFYPRSRTLHGLRAFEKMILRKAF